MTSPDEVLTFWFGERCETADEIAALVEKCFEPNPDFDAEIAARFGDLPDRALAGDLATWRDAPRSAVALILVVDQFPRNLHRGSPRAFAYDDFALEVASAWVDEGADRRVAPIEAVFGYLPFEHAESLEAQERCVGYYEALAARVPATLQEAFSGFTGYAERHRAVIRRFGRFPHRNAVLGRESTVAEASYLEGGGDTFGS